MATDLTLTPSELKAKEYMISLYKNAVTKPCDVGDGSNITTMLPDWFNAEQFKRGQKYFMDNRFGMLGSNLYGLFTLLADPKGLEVLDSTGRSSTPETAKKRYVSTIVHMLSWYEVELRPGSKSWDSMSRVRKMHLLASNSANKKQIGYITQVELALTTFGFMGFALVRPQLLGIQCDNREDREAFIHFWAVVGHILGVEDDYNMCLFDIETVETICMIMLRYIFIPLIQLETPKFKAMTKALMKGLSPLMPHMSYDIQMFLVKRIIGVPGYQYSIDLSKEKICRNIFTTDELTLAKDTLKMLYKDKEQFLKIYDILFDDGIPVIAAPNDKSVHIDMSSKNGSIEKKNLTLESSEWIEIGDKKFKWIMRSNDNADWKDYLSNKEFFALSKWDQMSVRWICLLSKWCNYSVGRYFSDLGLSVVLFFIRRHYSRTAPRKSG